MNEYFNYTTSGLDYVYLANGYRLSDGEYGPGFAIDDLDGLHDEIARHVVASPARLRGQEVRSCAPCSTCRRRGLPAFSAPSS